MQSVLQWGYHLTQASSIAVPEDTVRTEGLSDRPTNDGPASQSLGHTLLFGPYTIS